MKTKDLILIHDYCGGDIKLKLIIEYLVVRDKNQYFVKGKCSKCNVEKNLEYELIFL